MCSKQYELRYGVPQGSVLGPMLYTAYTAPVADIIDGFGVNFYIYADNTQQWAAVDLDDPISDISIKLLEYCTRATSNWLIHMKLKLNAGKTELLVSQNWASCLPKLSFLPLAKVPHITKHST